MNNKLIGMLLIFAGIAWLVLYQVFGVYVCFLNLLEQGNGFKTPGLIFLLIVTPPFFVIQHGIRGLINDFKLTGFEKKISRFEIRYKKIGNRIIFLFIGIALFLTIYVIWDGISRVTP